MAVTCVFILVGVALLASSVLLANYFFRKIHWFCRNVRESHNITVWIGSERYGYIFRSIYTNATM